jgi:DNA-binding beta-propeller fold protein YncE
MNKLAVLLSAALLLSISDASRVSASACPEHVNMWGESGPGPGQLLHPYGLGVGSSGVIYVVDGLNDRIQRFSSDGIYLGEWGTTGSLPGQFEDPLGLEVQPALEDTVYVVDWLSRRVQKFTGSGNFLLEWGSYGIDPGQFIAPVDAAVDGVGHVFVTDGQLARVQKFTTSGAFLAEWGEYGFGDGQFEAPSGIAVDADGYVYVADHSDRVQVFDSFGIFVRSWGSSGALPGQFDGPLGITVDPDSQVVYVADTGNDRIQKFTLTGTFLCAFGSTGSGSGELAGPKDVCIGGMDGRSVLVSEDSNHRVQVFSYDTVSSVESVPTPVRLDSYPNPFSRQTTIEYDGVGEIAEVVVYDVRGRHVRTMVEGRRVAGAGSVAWDGTGARGEKVPAGVYFVRMVSGAHEVTRRIVLLR